MANISGMHDPTGGEMAKPFEAGEYTLSLVKSEMMESKKVSGNYYLACEFEIEGSPRRVWVNYNLVNANATAQEIGWRVFNSLKHACGKLNVDDSEELHGIPFRARIGFEKGDADRLKLGQVKPLNGAATGSAQASAGSSAGGGQEKPWLKKSA